MTSRLQLRVQADEFDQLFTRICGGPRRVRDARRLTGGSAKGVYRLLLDDGSTVIGYVWSRDEDYWTAPGAGGASATIGGLQFAGAHAALSEAGVRVPRVLGLDLSRADRDGDFAFLEDLRGGTLEAALEAGGEGSETTLAQFAELVSRLHGHRAEWFGPPAPPEGLSPEALPEAPVAETAPRSAPLAVQITEDAEQELDDAGTPVLIDIETAAYEDAEREHAFLELRFGRWYRALDTDGLDPDRLSLYRLTTYLGLVAGPLRLLEGDFPDRAFMLDVVEQNVRRVLGQLG